MIILTNDEMIIKAWIPEIVNTDTGYIPVLISNTDKYNILEKRFKKTKDHDSNRLPSVSCMTMTLTQAEPKL